MIEAETGGKLLTTVFAFNTIRLQRFALVEVTNARTRNHPQLELFEIPLTANIASNSITSVTVYTTTERGEFANLTKLDEMLLEEENNQCPGPEFFVHPGACLLTPARWTTPLTVVDGPYMKRYRGRCDLVNIQSGMNTVGI